MTYEKGDSSGAWDATAVSQSRLSGKKEAVEGEKNLEEPGGVAANTRSGQMELQVELSSFLTAIINSERDFLLPNGSRLQHAAANFLEALNAPSVPEAPKSEGGSEYCQCEDQAQCRHLSQYRCVHCGKPFATSSMESVERNALSLQRALNLLGAAKCPDCDGSGAIQVQTSSREYVTREMALDAGDPSMEGSLYRDDEFEVEQCQWCQERDCVLSAPSITKSDNVTSIGKVRMGLGAP